MSFPNDRVYQFDINLQFADGAAAATTNGFLQVGGAAGIVDLGGNQATSPVEQARIDAVAVVNVTALDISSTDETYTLMVVVSNDPSMLTGNVQAGGLQLGKGTAATMRSPNSADSVVGTYEIMFSTNVAGSLYQYAAVYLTVAGTTPSITANGFFSVLPEM
jgi:hypothetical protein